MDTGATMDQLPLPPKTQAGQGDGKEISDPCHKLVLLEDKGEQAASKGQLLLPLCLKLKQGPKRVNEGLSLLFQARHKSPGHWHFLHLPGRKPPCYIWSFSEALG